MRRTKTTIVMVVAALVATVFTLSGPAPAGAAVIPSTAEVQFLSLLNQSRAAAGLGPMVRDGGVDGVARAWSQSMAAVYAATGDPVVKPLSPNDCRQSSLCHRPDLVVQVGAVVPQWLTGATVPHYRTRRAALGVPRMGDAGSPGGRRCVSWPCVSRGHVWCRARVWCCLPPRGHEGRCRCHTRTLCVW